MPTTNANVRQAFDEGRIIKRRTDDPAEAALEGGEIWFRTDTNEWRGYDGTAFGTLDFSADA